MTAGTGHGDRKTVRSTGYFLGWTWAVLACAAAAISLTRPGQALTAATLILSAIIACPPAVSLLERLTSAKLGGGLRGALVVIFAGLAGLSMAQTGRLTSFAGKAALPVQVRTLLDDSANGNKKTRSFTTQGKDWNLEWSFDCATLGDSGIFNVRIMRQNGVASGNAAVEKIDASGSGTEHFHEGGTFYLDVISECPWRLRAAG